MNINKQLLPMITLALISGPVLADIAPLGNTSIESFSKAKKYISGAIYSNQKDQKTFYCDWPYSGKSVHIPENEVIQKYKSRSTKIEIEHVIAAEWFGKGFSEWRNGDPQCVTSKGKPFKGRNCASKVNKQYRLMQSDLWNLVPTSGMTNAIRSNYRFTQFSTSQKSILQTCSFKIQDRAVEPRPEVRGWIARTHLYFEAVYPQFRLSDSQRKLMNVWDRAYPLNKDSFECRRYPIIKRIQGNDNPVLKDRCDV